MNANSHKIFLVAGFISLIMLPGCKWFETSKEEVVSASTRSSAQPVSEEMLTGDVIVTMNGKPIITSGILEEEKENIFKSNPQIRAAIAFMDPKVLDRNLTDGLVGQAVVDQYVKEQKLNQSDEYKAELRDAQKAIERMLNAKYFSQKFKVSVTDAEVKDFYETNKDTMPGLLLSQGGVVASGIEFDDEGIAKEFAAKARGNFKKAADDAGLSSKIKDFKMVNSQSIGIDSALRDKIIAIKHVPSVEIIPVGKSFWVINATAKEEAKYRPFEQLKDNIKQELEKNKRGEMFEKEVNELKKKYNIVINEDYFKGAELPASEMSEELGQFDTDMTGGMTKASDNQKSSKGVA